MKMDKPNSSPMYESDGRVFLNVLKIILSDAALLTSLKTLPSLKTLMIEAEFPSSII